MFIFRLILAKRVKQWSRAWDGKALYCERRSMWAVTGIWPQKGVFRSQIYSARAKLMHISDQARDLVKNCFEGRPLCVPFRTARLYPGSWINRLSKENLHVMIYTGRNNVFPFFVNSTETWSCLNPSRFRPAETWWSSFPWTGRVSVMFPSRKRAILFPPHFC